MKKGKVNLKELLISQNKFSDLYTSDKTNKLENINNSLNNSILKQGCIHLYIPDPNHEYSGDLILREIAILDQISTGGTQLALYITIGRILIYFTNLVIHYDQLADYTMADIHIFISFIAITLTIHFINLKFIVFGVVDFRRKLFFLKVLMALIDPEGSLNEEEITKSIPVINITCPNNIRRWMRLRRSSLDLGKKYTYRVFLYSSMFIGLYGLIAVYLTLNLFELLDNEISLTVYIIGYYDVFVI